MVKLEKEQISAFGISSCQKRVNIEGKVQCLILPVLQVCLHTWQAHIICRSEMERRICLFNKPF